ncbi:MAG: UDP-N-acetylglucosamine 2-epimerase (non-hydrolyzing) [Candidatus Anoxymicrobium japonicum]|uniref:UDP-N-acetylglucosamine 2-epimerase (Non-hydrolyzing) n=1 Tax=Candidatus Anoxymicrobium japonicum TaxID=2013648 RepID=A0A2N3G745_9ACTN|nr:MAG: UDP-N-acetylglucosamine 2-epimerase (non-hydrolyzing) [Candidatus Anoxymicrobium japonicum]
MKIGIVFGTRPEIIKLSVLIKLAERAHHVELETIHTGQHYSYNLSARFLEDLDLPRISENIEVGSTERLEQIRKITRDLEPLFSKSKNRPDVVVVQGDTNSVLAGAIAARNAGIPCAHVEAGLRCFDPEMIEEINRKETDRICDLRFAVNAVSVQNLANEGISDGSVMEVGNTIVEVICENLEISSRRYGVLAELGLEPDGYVLITIHRKENVDDEKRLSALISAWERIELPMLYTIHPHAMERVVEFELLRRLEAIENLKVVEPLSYWDFLELSRNSRMIISDSGGIQEECTVYKRPVIVARDSTERPEIIGSFGEIVGNDQERIIAEVARLDRDFNEIIERLSGLPSPYGDGKASERILDALLETYG